MADQVFIQHRFNIIKDGQSYSDALVMLESEYKKLKSSDIESMKQDRFNNWQNAIKNPPKVQEPSDQEKLDSINKDLASIEEQKQILLNQKTITETAISTRENIKKIGGK